MHTRRTHTSKRLTELSSAPAVSCGQRAGNGAALSMTPRADATVVASHPVTPLSIAARKCLTDQRREADRGWEEISAGSNLAGKQIAGGGEGGNSNRSGKQIVGETKIAAGSRSELKARGGGRAERVP